MPENTPLSLTPRAIARFMRSARDTEAGLTTWSSVEEQIAGAFLAGRLDLLPLGYERPLDALTRLGITGLCTMLHVHRMKWRSEYETTVETLG